MIDNSAYRNYTGTLQLEPTAPADLTHVALGTAATVPCAGTTGGVVWQPNDPDAAQVRLVFPNPARVHHTDLDCDGFPATGSGGEVGSDVDCDDLVYDVNPGIAGPACGEGVGGGGADPSCGAPQPPVTFGSCRYDAADNPNLTCLDTTMPTGTSVCDGETGASGCAQDPACVCSSSNADTIEQCLYCPVFLTTDAAGVTTVCPVTFILPIYGAQCPSCTPVKMFPSPVGATWSASLTEENPVGGEFTIAGLIPAMLPASVFVEVSPPSGSDKFIGIHLVQYQTSPPYACPAGVLTVNCGSGMEP